MRLPEGVVFLITRRKQFGPTTFLWDVQAPDVARAARPGHFVMAGIDEHGERIPFTVADFNVHQGTVTVVIQAVGKTTFEMMACAKAIPSSTLSDLSGCRARARRSSGRRTRTTDVTR